MRMTERTKWAVYCREGHSCIGPFDTELEALGVAIEMTQKGAARCAYDTIPLLLLGPEDKPANIGQYL